MELNKYKSMAPDDLHPVVLRELADAVGKPLSIIFEESCQLCEVPGDLKRETTLPFQKRVELGSRGTIEW